MKKLISFCVLLLIGLYANAQSESETLEWLKVKQPEIKGNTITIDENAIRFTEKDKTVTIQWSKVKDVTAKFLTITVVGNEVVDGKNVFINFYIDREISEKYAKALKHFAELKGARLVKDDLFQK